MIQAVQHAFQHDSTKEAASPRYAGVLPIAPDSRGAATAAISRTLAGVVTRWWRSRTQTARQMRLVETLAIGPKRSVALLELDGQQFLVGMGADGVSTLLQIQQRPRAAEPTA